MGTLRDVLNDLTPLGTAGDTLVVNGTADGVEWAAGGGGGAPTGADYLVKTANAGLSAERVVTDGTAIVADWATPGAVTLNFAPTASVDFLQQQALQFRIENRTSDPGSPAAGEIWLRTDL